jgi:peptide/nickel transport system substrate-binding protein
MLQRAGLGGRRRTDLITALAAISLAVVATGCTAAPIVTEPPASVTTTTTHSAPTGTVTWAEAPSSAPDWIFPFASLTHYFASNINQFQYLMYRPLYFFGPIDSTSPMVDEALSLAELPKFSAGNETVTIDLKGWKFSNGQTVDAQSVIFWMNMLEAERTNWAGYAPGELPDNVTRYAALRPSSLEVTFHFRSSYSQTWLLYNELSQITPMPEAWDITRLGGKPGSGGCARSPLTSSVLQACREVWAFDTDHNDRSKPAQMAGDLATYGSNPLWKVGDGPWTLSRFDSVTGEATFVPNTDYSGPKRSSFAKFVELPFASETAELAALSRSGSGAPDVGYLPVEAVPTNSGPLGSVGPNAPELASRYDLFPAYGWALAYAPANFNSVGDGGYAGAILRQAYIRHAIQRLVDQPAIIRTVYRGYGVETLGPVPIYPRTPYLSVSETDNPYPYSPSVAIELLAGHGWTIHRGGTDVCARPGTGPDECGKSIARGAQLFFTWDLVCAGSETGCEASKLEKATLAAAGVTVTAGPFSDTEGSNSACKPGPTCGWAIGDPTVWTFTPQVFPSGEYLFSTGVTWNYGSWNDSETDLLISRTLVSSSLSALYQYEGYLAKQLPVIWQPAPAASLTEVRKGLLGVTPISSLSNLTPEYWHAQ